MLDTLNKLDCILLGDNHNVGLGEAFNEMDKLLASQDCRGYLYFDQDTIVEDSAWRHIARDIEKSPSECIFFTEMSRKKTTLFINSGIYVPKNVVECIGLHDSRFFVEGVDYEYSLRMSIGGLDVKQIGVSGIDHNTGQDFDLVNIGVARVKCRFYPISRILDFNRAHIKLLAASAINLQSSHFVFFTKSFIYFNAVFLITAPLRILR